MELTDLSIILAVCAHIDTDGLSSDPPFVQAWLTLHPTDRETLCLSVGPVRIAETVQPWKLQASLAALRGALRATRWEPSLIEDRLLGGALDAEARRISLVRRHNGTRMPLDAFGRRGST